MKKNKKIIAVVALSFVAVLFLGSVVYNSHANNVQTTYLSASWEYNYKDVKEISNASDLIALVKVDGVKDTSVDQNVPYSEFKVDVVNPVYNTNKGDNLTILMTGGEIKGRVTELQDDPLLQSGDEILIFCKRNTDGTYRILSGPQGRLVYNDGKLNSLNVSNARVRATNSASNINIQNMDADKLISQIKGYVDAE
jgi:hypothetical protein